MSKLPLPGSSPARRLFRFRRLLTAAVIAVLAGSGWIAHVGVRAQQASPDGISPEALAQIEALLREKATRTPAEQKIDAQLLYALRMDRGEPAAPGVPTLQVNVPRGADGQVLVDITGRVTTDLLASVTSAGGAVVDTIPQATTLRAQLPIAQIEALAAREDVIFIQPRQQAMTHRAAAGNIASGDRASRRRVVADRLRRMLAAAPGSSATASAVPPAGAATRPASSSALGNAIGTTGQGTVSGEGDVTHQAYIARAVFGIDGTGVKIGVLSDGVTSLAEAQMSGNLPAVTVLPGQTGSGDEGTAMLEIIHDVAPGAQLYFATAFTSITSFAQNIRDLRAAGCDIIVDDVFYFAESPFQDGQAVGVVSPTNGGVVTQAVIDVTNAGALFFSSAGNSGNLNDGQSGVWEGDFVDGGLTAAPLPDPGAGNLHSFGGTAYNALTVATDNPTSLTWSDPLGGSSNDYDLFRLNSTGAAVVASSTNIQTGTQDPFEIIGGNNASERLVIVKKTGAAGRFLHLNTNRGRLTVGTSGTTGGHSQAALAFSTAATPAFASYPAPFTTANVVETFSSDGPRRLFFQANGTPFTPGNFSATGGIVRQKPDITAADGVFVTGVGGFDSPFFGTSAAAPYAAAIAALIKDAVPAATPAQIRTWLTSTALDIEAPGVDRDSGAGIVMPVPALQAAGLTAGAGLALDSFTAAEAPGNSNGLINAGEGATLAVTLENVGTAAATAIGVTLSTTTPGVTVHQPNSVAVPAIAAGASGTTPMPFAFTVASTAPCPLDIDFTLTVTYAGGPGTVTLPFTVPTGGSELLITSALGSPTPSASGLYTVSTGSQTGRVNRNGTASTCAAGPKTFPGTVGPGTRQYDAYTFTTCAVPADACAQVGLTAESSATAGLFSTAYSGSFVPGNIATNYRADAGQSNLDQLETPYSFEVGAAGDTFVVVVNEVNQATAAGADYQLRITGACLGDCVRNGVPTAVAQNITLSAGAGGTATGSVDNGSSDPNGDPLTITQSPAGPYPVGTTAVLLTVKDDKGATSQATANVTVVPSVLAITPTSGRASGGNLVTITGSGFSTLPGGTTVTFGGTPATAVTCAVPVTCTANAPAGTGTVSVLVTVGGLTSSGGLNYSYTPAPTVTAIAPASGPPAGGTVVAITGTGFATAPGATAVIFGAAAATGVVCASTTACQATAPPGTGTVNVSVMVDFQSSANTAADDFTYLDPLAPVTYYLAEGATGTFFTSDVLIANPNTAAAPVTMTFFLEGGGTVIETRTLAAQSRMTVHVNDIPGLDATSAAVEVRSDDRLPLAVERTMFWDASGYGGHTSGSVPAPANEWLFAEGSQGFFDTFVLVTNPAGAAADVTFTFLPDGGAPVVRTYPLAANSRLSVHAGSIPELVDRSFGIRIQATTPVVAERSMYFGSTPTRLWSGGHASGGTTASDHWFLAEGATGSFFKTFLLLSNPDPVDAQVTLTYLLDGGETITVPKVVPASGRLTVNIETEDDARLQNAAVSTIVNSNRPIAVERSMYWAGESTPWGEAHNSTGLTELGTSWGLAEGRVGGDRDFKTFILLANPQTTTAEVTVTFLRESGAAIVKNYTVPPTSRFNIETHDVVPELANESFGVRIDVTNGTPIAVERSMYWNASGVFWAGGTNAVATRLP